MTTQELARRLGRRGGLARARRLNAEERRRIASLGGVARHQSVLVRERVRDNFRYLAAALELWGGSPEVDRLKTFEGRLPGIYPNRS